jgi:anti-sigma B factor antagonist
MSLLGFVSIVWWRTVYSCAHGHDGPEMTVRRMDDELTISVSPEPGYVVVSVAGEIDMATAPQFREQLSSVISGGARRVVVDLARVTFMASAGISVLIGTHRALVAESGSLVLASPSLAARRILALVGLDQVIPVTGSVADAAARWAPGSVELSEAIQSEHAGLPAFGVDAGCVLTGA